ncbi:MAG: glycosyltransferase, partial [Verrucomicrobiota bacterium]
MSISLVLIYRRVTPAINKLFDSVIGQIDEYILVNTGPDDADGSQALVEAAVEPGVPTVHLEYRCPREWELEGTKYIGDFAAARTYAHRHATGTWHLSLDSDDELRGASLQDCLVAAVQEDPHVNCISMSYFYQDTRIVHDRPRLWRADLAWTWRYELHEIRVPAGGGRVVVYPTDRCEVVHHGDPEASERRNTAMVAWLMEQPDPSDHVRLARAAATAKQGFYATACRLAKQLWKENPKGDLNYRAGLVAAQACYDSGNRIRARALLGGLIATQPENRIAYLDLAAFLVDQGELREAARLFKQAFLELPQNQSYEFMTTPHWVDIELRSRAVEVLATVGNYEAAREIYQRGPASAARLEEAHAFLEQEEGLAKVARAIDTVTHYFLDTGFIERAEKLVDDLVTEELAPRVAEIRKQVHECGLQYEKVSASACEKLAQVLAGTTGYAVPPSRSVHDVLSGGECVETSPGGWRVVRSRSQRRVPLHVVAPGPLLWGPQAHQRRGIGGSEQAVINLVPFWADQYDVHVWASRLEEETF